MKRHGNLWKDVIAFENLLAASRKAQRGKRFRDNVLSFNYNLEKELFQLKAELQSKTYKPGLYTTFRIFEPKPRLISAAPYRDRVVHALFCVRTGGWEFIGRTEEESRSIPVGLVTISENKTESDSLVGCKAEQFV